jgi:pepF/M3 family oligoendopeptidase
MLAQCIYGLIGCVGFAILFNIHGPGGILCGMGGFLSWAVYCLTVYLGGSEILAYFWSALFASVYSETMAGIRNLANDPDPNVRREAYLAELASYEAVKEPVAHALNAIKQSTITECRMRGYANVLDWSLKQAKMERVTLEAMLSAAKDSLPKLRQYLKAKAKLLGHEGGLPWYDLNAPVGEAGKRYSPEEARDYLLKLFYKFDEQLGSMMETAFREAWIDFHPRAGKRDGAFCSSSRTLGRSWILTNYGGTIGSVKTLAHELGHAFHNICILDHRPLNKGYGRPVAETASTFNECVVYGSAIDQARTPDEELALVEKCLAGDATMILDIYSRFLFEDEVIRRRETEFLSADTLCEIMLRAQKEAYGDALDENFLHPYMWICKPHYYSAFYYNYPYIFGTLFSRGLYARYKAEGPAFVPKYKKLLYTTTVATVEDTAKVADIDLTQKAFWQEALDSLGELVDRFCRLTEK